MNILTMPCRDTVGVWVPRVIHRCLEPVLGMQCLEVGGTELLVGLRTADVARNTQVRTVNFVLGRL